MSIHALKKLEERLDRLESRMGERVFGKSLLAEGTDAATLKTTNAFDYSIAGVMYSKAATDNIAMTALPVQVDGSVQNYFALIDVAGAVSLLRSDVGFTPVIPAGKVVFGIVTVSLSGGAFTSGTTDLSGTGVTATYADKHGIISSV